jgi:hypothetical protein
LFDSCIGQVAPSMQQAIRASGVACQPAHTATFPAHNARHATNAAIRLDVVTVHLACETDRVVSNRPRWMGELVTSLYGQQFWCLSKFLTKSAAIAVFVSRLPESRNRRIALISVGRFRTRAGVRAQSRVRTRERTVSSGRLKLSRSLSGIGHRLLRHAADASCGMRPL